jgi:anti-anti-sigma regulatory factor
MADKLTVTRTEQGRVMVLHLAGVLNAQSENTLVETVGAAHHSAHFLLLDLTDVELVTSAGLRAFQNIYRLYTARDEPQEWEADHPGEVYKSPHIKIAGAAPQVHYVLSLSGFLQHIPIFPTVQEALDSFGS